MDDENAKIAAMFEAAKNAETQARKIQQEIARTTVIGEAGNGAIKIFMRGMFVADNIDLDEAILKKELPELANLIAEAINDASKKVMQATETAFAKMTPFLPEVPDEYKDS